jgi:hypothetical protein
LCGQVCPEDTQGIKKFQIPDWRLEGIQKIKNG